MISFVRKRAALRGPLGGSRGWTALWALLIGARLVRKLTQQVKFSLVDQTKMITAASELSRNTLVHGRGGAMRWELLDDGHLRPYLASRLGPEPLAPSFTSARLARIVAGRRAPIKAVLLDQRRIAGIGNIYADEALWRARIHPRRPAGELDAPEIAHLHRAVRAALRRGVELNGSTLRDYVTPDGEGGGMQHEFHVYGRLGDPCDRCGRPIERIVVGGRGTWLCSRCQTM